MPANRDILIRLVACIRNVHDQGAYDLDNEESNGEYKTWQSKCLKALVAEADVIIANTSAETLTHE